jgi:hypothetical protein
MRDVLFVLALVVAVFYWVTHPDQVQSAVDRFGSQVQTLIYTLKR